MHSDAQSSYFGSSLHEDGDAWDSSMSLRTKKKYGPAKYLIKINKNNQP